MSRGFGELNTKTGDDDIVTRCDSIYKKVRSKTVTVKWKINKTIFLGMWQRAVYKILPEVSGQPTFSIFEDAVRFSKTMVRS